MARVTVEDCLKNVKNRFELVILAAKRARQLMRGKEPKVEWDNDKPTVVALREIALGFVDIHDHETHEEQQLIKDHHQEIPEKPLVEDEKHEETHDETPEETHNHTHDHSCDHDHDHDHAHPSTQTDEE